MVINGQVVNNTFVIFAPVRATIQLIICQSLSVIAIMDSLYFKSIVMASTQPQLSTAGGEWDVDGRLYSLVPTLPHFRQEIL
jgi:hypothetical protein